VKNKYEERGCDTTFIEGKQDFKARNIFREYPIILLVTIDWKQGKALRSEKVQVCKVRPFDRSRGKKLSTYCVWPEFGYYRWSAASESWSSTWKLKFTPG
jgi:hypothetical protein